MGWGNNGNAFFFLCSDLLDRTEELEGRWMGWLACFFGRWSSRRGRFRRAWLLPFALEADDGRCPALACPLSSTPYRRSAQGVFGNRHLRRAMGGRPPLPKKSQGLMEDGQFGLTTRSPLGQEALVSCATVRRPSLLSPPPPNSCALHNVLPAWEFKGWEVLVLVLVLHRACYFAR
ncbi:hypothetical protein BS50DRAFT_137447 [Corynespora cassiicola Philippines]|uniref:Uncharacterized protein n=1 Tax=Corynespora cassiicola Philippines TaxID=1448308 RepID=A0A2T2N9K1_CORCC|nr:hypothetical protein BS50DRAFT_137447 [Corynespora cassiicola Philippines]